jgi:hypothetical protein
MAGNSNGSMGGGFIRRVAPFAPLALSLLMSRAVIPNGAPAPAIATPASATGIATTPSAIAANATCASDVDTVQTCHSEYPTGCSRSPHPDYDAYLNLLKNRLISPSAPAVVQLDERGFSDLNSKTPTGLTSKNHQQLANQLAALNEGKVGSVIAYLYYARFGGTSETVNCELHDPDEIDYHIGIGFDPSIAGKLVSKANMSPEENSALETTSVIVEMTPHYRARFEPGWTLDALKPLVGRQVRVTGQLLIDNEHVAPNANCGAPNANTSTCWRFSAWELHPVTRFEICQSTSQVCTANSGEWVALENFGQTAGTGTPPATAMPSPSATSPASGTPSR